MKPMIAALTLLVAVAAYAADTRPAVLTDVGIDQRLDEQVPLDLVFRDESGASVQLGTYFGSKPVILSLAYYECPMLARNSRWSQSASIRRTRRRSRRRRSKRI